MNKKVSLKLAIVLLCQVTNINAQIDLRDYVKPIYEGKESTALSIYDASPESPNGKYVCFIRYPEIVTGGHAAPRKQMDVMLLNKTDGTLRQIYDVWCNNHNGANAIWVNDSLVAFQVSHLGDFVVYNINTDKSEFGLISGELGHKSFNNTLIYSVCSERFLTLDSYRTPYDPELEGIYSLNCLTGEKKLLVRKKDLVKSFHIQNPNTKNDTALILHIEPNSTNASIMFDFKTLKLSNKPRWKSWQSFHGFVNADGTDIQWSKKCPMHVVWFNETSMVGVDTKDPERKICSYDLYGNRIEILAGSSCHTGISPNREWYVGERGYYKTMPDGYIRVFLYRRGETKPYALLAEWKNNKITWEWVAHVNPSFSFDGERLYFVRARDDEDKFEAVYMDMNHILHIPTKY